MESVNISTFKATCLALMEKVRRTGQPLLVHKRGKPIVQILPPPEPEKSSWLGKYQTVGKVTGDIISPAIDLDDWEVLI